MALLTTLGAYVASARKKAGLNQKGLAEMVKKEGQPISPQYLNDIEHDRRVPSSEVLNQIAEVLKLDSDYLHYLARKWPEDIAQGALAPAQVRELMYALRRAEPKVDDE